MVEANPDPFTILQTKKYLAKACFVRFWMTTLVGGWSGAYHVVEAYYVAGINPSLYQ
jgi:hypothetical protein